MEYTKQSTIIRLSKIDPFWASMLATKEWDDTLLKNIAGTYIEGGELQPNETREDADEIIQLFNEGKAFDIAQYCCCIVGEAHCKDESYQNSCSRCYNYSMLFGTGNRSMGRRGSDEHFIITILKNEDDWIEWLNEFLDHFAEAHATDEQKKMLVVV